MSLYQLKYEQVLETSLDEAWSFFCNPYNLARITPEWLSFEVLDTPTEKVHPGLILRYRIRPLGGIPVTWVTEITHVRENTLFVDEQRFGPYRFWHHLHYFEQTEEGIRMLDLVHYRLYGGRLTTPLHRFLVRPRLEGIFEYRRQVLAEQFRKNPKLHKSHQDRKTDEP